MLAESWKKICPRVLWESHQWERVSQGWGGQRHGTDHSAEEKQAAGEGTKASGSLNRNGGRRSEHDTLHLPPSSSCCPLTLQLRFSSVKTASGLLLTAASAYARHQWSDWRINKGSLQQLRWRGDPADPITSYLLVFSWFILLSITALEILYLTWYNSDTLYILYINFTDDKYTSL